MENAENRENRTKDRFADENRLLVAGLLSEYRTITPTEEMTLYEYVEEVPSWRLLFTRRSTNYPRFSHKYNN